jgi:hypothetical protein
MGNLKAIWLSVSVVPGIRRLLKNSFGDEGRRVPGYSQSRLPALDERLSDLVLTHPEARILRCLRGLFASFIPQGGT